MKKRLITAIVALIVFIPVLIFSDTWIFPSVASFACAIACYEMFSCIGQKKNIVFTLPAYLVAIFFPLFVRFAYLSDNINRDNFIKLALAVAIIAPLYMFAVAVFQSKKLAVTDAGLAAISCFYIISALTALVYVHDFVPLGEHVYLLCFNVLG